MMQVVLPWPPKELSPNARQHWAALARVKKQYRTTCWALTRQAMDEIGMASHRIITITPPDVVDEAAEIYDRHDRAWNKAKA